MSEAFDSYAIDYDSIFTQSPIGRIQRRRVWDYLKAALKNKTDLNILEVNCGTGEDAIYLSKMGHNVCATDVSEEMLSQGRIKAQESNTEKKIQFEKLDLSNPENTNERYDLIFSNFGGLNCLDETALKKVCQYFENILNKNGECIFVIMPKHTFFEKLYRALKSESQVYKDRTNKKGLEVNLGDRKIKTYFYNPKDLIYAFDKFQKLNLVSIGYLPSYFNQSKFLSPLMLIDKIFHTLGVSAKRSDHFLIHLKKNS